MSIRVRATVHHDQIPHALAAPGSAGFRFVETRTQLTENFAKAACPVDEGTLRNSIRHTPPRVEGHRIIGEVYSPLPYAKWVHDGTGIYGPRRQFITPTRGRYLVFAVKGPVGPMPRGKSRPAVGSRPVVFARRVRGMPGVPFLVMGLEQAMPGALITRHNGP